MYAAVRPYATAGVALLGAGVIAVSPLAPPMPNLQAVQRAVSSAGVELDAAVNPIDRWAEVLQAAAANIGAIGQAVFDNPAPILSQIIANQTAYSKALGDSLRSNGDLILSNLNDAPGYFRAALDKLQAGDITGAVDTVNNSVVIPLVLGLLQIPSDILVPLTNMAQNFAKVVATLPTDLFAVVLPLTLPLVSAIDAIAQTTQDVVQGAGAGDAHAVVNALVNAPANLVDGVLNGAGNILGFIPGAGVLTPYDPTLGFLASGPISSLNALRETIAEALGKVPPPAVAAAAVTSLPTATKMVTLTTTAAPDNAPSATVHTTRALVKKAESSASSADSSVGGLQAAASSDSAGSSDAAGSAASSDAAGSSDASDSSDSAGSAVKGGHDSAKPGPAHAKHASSGKAGKPGASRNTGTSGKQH